MKKNIAIVVNTHSSMKDLWKMFIGEFEKYFPGQKLYFFSNMKNKYRSYYFLPFFVPVFFNTLFDVTMENSHYPLIFYFVIGMMYNKEKFFMTNKTIT